MPTAVGKHRSGRSAGAAARTWAAGSGRWARDWGRPGGCRRELTDVTDFLGPLLREGDGRTATVSCGCGARAIRGSSQGKPHLRFRLRTRLGALLARGWEHRRPMLLPAACAGAHPNQQDQGRRGALGTVQGRWCCVLAGASRSLGGALRRLRALSVYA